VNPVSGRPEVTLVSEAREVEAGRDAAEKMADVMGIVDEPALAAYVEKLGQRIAARSPRGGIEYSFRIVDQPEPNAFAVPGGFIFVSRGLLPIMNSEDELANVLAHEVVHVAARHHAQLQTRAAGVGLLALPGRLAGAVIGGPVGDAVSAPFAIAGLGLLASYGRDQERQADRVGQTIAAEAGYDPQGMADFLENLEKATDRPDDEARIPAFFQTHPSNPKRVAEASARARDITSSRQPGVENGRGDFLERLDGVLIGNNPAEGILEGQRFLHPDLDFTMLFPEKWTVLNTRSAVGAAADEGDAQVVLELVGPGDDPEAAARVFIEKASEGVRLDVETLEQIRIRDLFATHVRAVVGMSGGALSLDLTWIVHDDRIFLLTGVVEGGYNDRHRAAFQRVAYSFRALRPDERDAIRETRLRVVEARGDESLAQLGSRTGNAWDVDVTAAMNALAKDVRLTRGQRVKIAVPRRYPGSRPAAAGFRSPPREAFGAAPLRAGCALRSCGPALPVGGSEPCPT
jgi:predicted Zn-dependent protease